MNSPKCDDTISFARWDFVHLQFYLAANPDFLQTRRIMNPTDFVGKKSARSCNALSFSDRQPSSTKKEIDPEGTC
jgi:hypothetical protein